MTRRARSREDRILQKVEKAIRRIEQRDDPVVNEAKRAILALRRAERVFEGNGRLDFANSVKAARLSLESHLSNLVS
jgi:hypothetical protein